VRVGISGHQRLPEAAERLLVEEIKALCAEPGQCVVVSSLAAGADQISAATALEAGAALEVVVPCLRYEETFNPGALSSYRRLLGAAADTRILPFTAPTEESFLAAGVVVVERCDLLVAVWDGEPARGLGGTADVVGYALQVGRSVMKVWPPGLTR